MQLEENSANTSRTSELEKDVKEKDLLIGKLRHESKPLSRIGISDVDEFFGCSDNYE